MSGSYSLFCIGNPLLDMQVVNAEGLLAKYEIKANDSILAEDKHAPLYASSLPPLPTLAD
jgi:adenosine kinase